VRDLANGERFFTAVLAPLGLPKSGNCPARPRLSQKVSRILDQQTRGDGAGWPTKEAFISACWSYSVADCRSSGELAYLVDGETGPTVPTKEVAQIEAVIRCSTEVQVGFNTRLGTGAQGREGADEARRLAADKAGRPYSFAITASEASLLQPRQHRASAS
jgi:hypothetical protein